MTLIALHQSTVHPMDPVRLVAVAREAGVGAIGLRVTAADDDRHWWSKGLGSAVLHDLIAALPAAGVGVLDIGRVELGPELTVFDGRHGYVRALDVGVRLGARHVTVRAGDGDAREQFAILAELAGRYGIRPLLTAVPGTAVDSIEEAADIARTAGGGVLLDVSPQAEAGAVADAIAKLGDVLTTVRVPARELETAPERPGLLAALPAGVDVAIGAAHTGNPAPDEPGPIDADHVARIARLRAAVETMLAPE
jgi:hypothetical protein